MTGTTIRLRRLAKEGRFVVVPMDHGVSAGPIKGLDQIGTTISAVDAGGATAILLHKGLVRDYVASKPRAGLIVHVSASSLTAPDPDEKRLVGTPSEVLSAGADAISVHVNVGSATESEQTASLGQITEEAAAVGLPVLAMMYPRGPKIKNPFDAKLVAHAARIGQELGADIVKAPYTGNRSTFRDVVESLSVPLVVAGGQPMKTSAQVIKLVADAMSAGAAGISIGRNVFQHSNPRNMTAALAAIVLEAASESDAARILKKGPRR